MVGFVVAHSAEQFELIEEELPDPGPGQVRVAVRAAALNPVDVKLLSGTYGPVEPPVRVGMEAAGVVVDVGPGADGPAGPIAVGDEVIVFRSRGALASEVVVPAADVFPKPPAFSFEEASGLLLTGTTAVHMIQATGAGAGERVLVHGAGGAVGVAVLQLLRERGAEVVGTGSERSAEAIRRFGATPVVYGPGLAGRVRDIWPEGPTVALDTVGTDEAIDVSVELVADRGRIATVGNIPRGLKLGLKALGGGGQGADPGTAIRDAARLDLVRLAGEGRLDVPVARSFPLGQTREAVELLASGHAGGKVVLVP